MKLVTIYNSYVLFFQLFYTLSQDEVLDFQSWLSDTKKQLMSREEADEGCLEDKINENQVSHGVIDLFKMDMPFWLVFLKICNEIAVMFVSFFVCLEGEINVNTS